MAPEIDGVRVRAGGASSTVPGEGFHNVKLVITRDPCLVLVVVVTLELAGGPVFAGWIYITVRSALLMPQEMASQIQII